MVEGSARSMGVKVAR
ncbi:MAG: hypothetical protein ACRDQ5_06050 [Sciscionella sp.]